MVKSVKGVDINPMTTLMLQLCFMLLGVLMLTPIASTSQNRAHDDSNTKIAVGSRKQAWNEDDVFVCNLNTDDGLEIFLTCDEFLNCRMDINEREVVRNVKPLPPLILLSDNCSNVLNPSIRYNSKNETIDKYHVLQNEILELTLNITPKTVFEPGYFCGLTSVTNMTFSNVYYDEKSLGFGESCSSLGCCVCNLKHLMINFNSDHATVIRNSFFCGMQNLTTLSLPNNAIAEIEDGAFLYLPSLERLELQNNRLVTLSMELFSTSYISLKYLDASNNKLNNEILNSLQTLTALEDLILDNNNISVLNSDSFKALKVLKRLSLNNNKVKGLGEEFQYLTNLEELDMSANKIFDVNRFPFNSLMNLTVLRLSGNRFSSIIDFISSDDYKLNVLDISHNKFIGIPSKLNYFKNLTDLDLAHNEITAISESDQHILCNIANLKSLSLANNSISNIYLGAFDCLTNLRKLILSRNSLTSILALKDSKVTYLDVYHNKILHIAVQDLPSHLVYLDASHNSLTEFHFENSTASAGAGRKMFADLQFLNLSRNDIQRLFIEECPSTALTQNPKNSNHIYENNCLPYIDLSFNYIQSVCTFILKMKLNRTMPTINFNDNQLLCKCEMEYLTKNYDNNIDDSSSIVHHCCTEHPSTKHCAKFSLGCLLNKTRHSFAKHDNTFMTYKRFSCDGGKESFLCNFHFDYSRICELPCPNQCNCFINNEFDLYLINCSNSHLSSLPNEQLFNMQAIVLFSGNQLSFVDSEKLSPYSGAIRLDLNKNKLQTIADKSFTLFNQLEILNMKGNSLSEIGQETFVGLKRLKELDLSNNRLVKIHQSAFLPLTSVQKLTLKHNKLSEISTSLLCNLKFVVERGIDLASNPWLCNCDSASFVRWVKTNSSLVKDYQKLQCLENGGNIPLITFNDTYCSDPPTTYANSNSYWVIIIVVLVVIIIGAIGIFAYFKRVRGYNFMRLRD